MPIAQLLRVKRVGKSHLGPIKATKSLGRIVEAIFIIKKFLKNISMFCAEKTGKIDVLSCKDNKRYFKSGFNTYIFLLGPLE